MSTSERYITLQTTTLDDSPSGLSLSSRFRAFAEIAGAVVATVSAFACLCIQAELPPAAAWLHRLGVTASITLGFVLTGISLSLQAKGSQKPVWVTISKGAAIAAFIQSATSLLLYYLGLPEPGNAANPGAYLAGSLVDLRLPGLVPHAIALNQLMVALSLCLMVDRPISFRQRSTVATEVRAASVSLLALIGYSCAIAGSFAIPHVHAAVFSLLYLGLIFAQPDRGPIAIIISEGIGGLVSRRLFFTALGVPLTLSWINLELQGAGLYEAEVGSSILVAAIIILLTTFIVINSASLERLDRQRLVAEAAQKENERQLTVQYLLTRVLAEADNLDEAISKILQIACQSMGWATAALWLVDKSANCLALKSLWHLPQLKLDAFESACKELRFEFGVGVPGRVWATGEPLTMMLAVDDSQFSRSRSALKCGLHADFAFPVKSGTEVVGVLEFFSRDIRRSDDSVQQIFTTLGEQFGQFIKVKEAVEALRANQKLTRMIIDKAYDAFIAVDESGQITDWNTQAEKTFGWSREEALGRSLDSLLMPGPTGQGETQGLERFRAKDGGLLLNKRGELTAVHRQGREFPVEVALLPVSQGDSKTICAFVHDITERKNAEALLVQAMRSEQRVAQAIVEHAPLGIARLDNDFIITEINPVLSYFLGKEPESLIGVNLLDLLPGLPRVQFSNIIRTGEPFVEESYKIDLPDRMEERDTYWDLAVWPIKGEQDTTRGIILLASDVTERVDLVRQREDFVAMLTHDLKAPLMGADRTLEMLHEEAFGCLDEREKDVIAKLRRSNQDLLSMIENLLGIYRYESGAEQFIFEEVDLSPLITNAIRALNPLAADKNIRISSSSLADQSTIQADPMALARLLTNLIMNAIKFTPSGGKIEVSVEQFIDTVMLKVVDTGIGIKREEMEKIFQRYWRAESSLYKTGSGLGLYLCWQIVQAHNGKITCHSELGSGTTFSIVLPVKQAREVGRL